MEYVVTPKTETIYYVEFRGKRASFRRYSAIIPWIAKQIMLPIFHKYYDEFGSGGDDEGNGAVEVWDAWGEVKPQMIEKIRNGNLQAAEDWLINFFENDYF